MRIRWTLLLLLTSISTLNAGDSSWTAHGKFLYWWSSADDIYVGHERRQEFESVSLNTIPGIAQRATVVTDRNTKIVYPYYKGQTGLKLGIGSECQENDWDIQLQWTHFDPNAKRSVRSTPERPDVNPMGSAGTTETPQLLYYMALINNRFFTFDDVQSFTTKWGLRLNFYDIECGHQFTNSWSFPFHCSVGVRVASIDQNFSIVTNGTLNGGEARFQLCTVYKSDFDGVGPRIGFTTEKPLFYGFGLYGKAAQSLLYGDRKATKEEQGHRFESPVPDINSRNFYDFIDNSAHDVKTISDMEIGLYWKSTFCQGATSVQFFFGWEQHLFFDMGSADAESLDIFSSEEDHDLSMQGLTLALKVGF